MGSTQSATAQVTISSGTKTVSAAPKTMTVTKPTVTVCVAGGRTTISELPAVRKRDSKDAKASSLTSQLSSFANMNTGTISVPQTTITTTSMFTSTIIPTQTANDQGIKPAYYADDYQQYTGYDPAAYKSVTPDGQGGTNQVGGPGTTNAGLITVYDSRTTVNGEFLAIDHRGYFISPTTGTYKFTSPYSGDYATMWLGPQAYSGWDFSNASIDQEGTYDSRSVTLALTKGVPLASRRFYYNTYSAGYFALEIPGPDGTIVEDMSTKTSPYVVQYTCDGSAPAFPPFGQET